METANPDAHILQLSPHDQSELAKVHSFIQNETAKMGTADHNAKPASLEDPISAATNPHLSLSLVGADLPFFTKSDATKLEGTDRVTESKNMLAVFKNWLRQKAGPLGVIKEAA
jgi:hypothetical protein